MILLVGLEMLGQVLDPGAQQCDLHFGRTRVALVGFEAGNNLFPFSASSTSVNPPFGKLLIYFHVNPLLVKNSQNAGGLRAGRKRWDLPRRNEHPGQRHEAPFPGDELYHICRRKRRNLQGCKALDIGLMALRQLLLQKSRDHDVPQARKGPVHWNQALFELRADPVVALPVEADGVLPAGRCRFASCAIARGRPRSRGDRPCRRRASGRSVPLEQVTVNLTLGNSMPCRRISRISTSRGGGSMRTSLAGPLVKRLAPDLDGRILRRDLSNRPGKGRDHRLHVRFGHPGFLLREHLPGHVQGVCPDTKAHRSLVDFVVAREEGKAIFVAPRRHRREAHPSPWGRGFPCGLLYARRGVSSPCRRHHGM